MADIFDLTGRVAVITGCATGLGVQMAKALANQGCNIVAIARRQNLLDEVTADIANTYGVKTLAVKLDITDTAAVDAAVDEIISKMGRIDILVNNAGITRDDLLMKMSEEAFDAVMNTNLKGCFNTIRHASRYL